MGMSVSCCQEQRCLPIAVLYIGVGASGEERLYDVGTPVICCRAQRCPPIDILYIGVRAFGEEALHFGVIALSRRCDERRVQDQALRLFRGEPLDILIDELGNVLIAVVSGDLRRSLANIVSQVHIGAGSEEQLDDVGMPELRGPVQGRLSHIVLKVGVSAFGKEQLYDVGEAVFRCPHEGCIAESVL